MKQLDIFEAKAVSEPDTREGRIVFRALRDSLPDDIHPWWREVTSTSLETIKSERFPILTGVNRASLDRYIVADVVDLFGHTSTYEVGNWCIGLSHYDDDAKVPDFAKGWDNAWSLHCRSNPSAIEWNRRRQVWIPVRGEAA